MPALSPDGKTQPPRTRKTIQAQLAMRDYGPRSGGHTTLPNKDYGPRSAGIQKRRKRKGLPQNMPGAELRSTAARDYKHFTSTRSRGLRDAFSGGYDTLKLLGKGADEFFGVSAALHGDPIAAAMMLPLGGYGRIGKFLLHRPEGDDLGRAWFRDWQGQMEAHPVTPGPLGERGGYNLYGTRTEKELRRLEEGLQKGRVNIDTPGYAGSMTYDLMDRIGPLHVDIIRREYAKALGNQVDRLVNRGRNIPPNIASRFREYPEQLWKDLSQQRGLLVQNAYLTPEWRRDPRAMSALISPVNDLSREGWFPWGGFGEPDLRALHGTQFSKFLQRVGLDPSTYWR